MPCNTFQHIGICLLFADLEKTVPEVSVDFWSRVMGRCSEDTQAEIENRIAKRGIHLLKKYSEYHKFLSERLFRLHASTFSTADKCIFYIGKKTGRYILEGITLICITLDEVRMAEALIDHFETCPFYNLVRYLPLVTPMAKDSMYRTVHPYAAKSTREFRSWNLGKQLAAEVSGPPTVINEPSRDFDSHLRCLYSFFVRAPFGDSFRIFRLSRFT